MDFTIQAMQDGAATSVEIDGQEFDITVDATTVEVAFPQTVNIGTGGEFDGVHNDLDGRSTADAHPISAITGLDDAIAAAGAVDSVNGQTGVVVLDADDVGATTPAAVAAGYLRIEEPLFAISEGPDVGYGSDVIGTETVVGVTGGVLHNHEVRCTAPVDLAGDELRAAVRIPDPDLWKDDPTPLDIVPDDVGGLARGPRIYFHRDTPAVLGDCVTPIVAAAPWDFSGGSATSVDFDVSGDTVTWVLNQNFAGDIAAVLGSLVAQHPTIFTVNGNRQDSSYYDIGGQRLVFIAIGTVAKGAGVTLTCTDEGPFTGLEALNASATEGADDVHHGWGGALEGTGYGTHGWPDVDMSGKGVRLHASADGKSVVARQLPPRSQYVNVLLEEIGGPLDLVTTAAQAFAETNESLKSIIDTVDGLVSGGTVDVVSNVAQARLLGRISSGSGDSEELTAAQARTLLGVGWVTLADSVVSNGGTGVASISVPASGYRHLRLRFKGRSLRTAVNTDTLNVTVNSDTNNRYSTNNGSLAAAWSISAFTASKTNTDRMGSTTIDIDCGNSSWTGFRAHTETVTSEATLSTTAAYIGGIYNQTTAITSVQVAFASANIADGSSLIVEGWA